MHVRVEIKVTVDADVFAVEREAESIESYGVTAIAEVDPKAVLAEAIERIERAL